MSCLACNSGGSLLAAGYTDGTIRLFDTAAGEEEVTFTGHKSAVTALAFHTAGLRLVSGSRDCRWENRRIGESFPPVLAIVVRLGKRRGMLGLNRSLIVHLGPNCAFWTSTFSFTT